MPQPWSFQHGDPLEWRRTPNLQVRPPPRKGTAPTAYDRRDAGAAHHLGADLLLAARDLELQGGVAVDLEVLDDHLDGLVF